MRKSIVGVNKYRLDEEAQIDARTIDNTEVRRRQTGPARAHQGRRATRSQVEAALDALTKAAEGDGNLLALSIEATRARATVGEISDALETGLRSLPRQHPHDLGCLRRRVLSDDEEFQRIRKEVDAFAAEEGRRPRILVAKLGQDGHDRGAKVIATAFADLGFDVDIGPLFQTPEEAAREAIENDVHVVGVSSQAAGHKTLVPQLIEALARAGRGRDRRRGRWRDPRLRLRVPARRGCRGDLRSRQQHPAGRVRGADVDPRNPAA